MGQFIDPATDKQIQRSAPFFLKQSVFEIELDFEIIYVLNQSGTVYIK